ncbi:MAG: VCBS repeat-containing protein [Saprospiraceae bacterium]|nr:VCBS repeat-containing protein [Saprospiraceae bacterium]
MSIPLILSGCIVKSQYSGIVLTGDTIVFELNETLGGSIQWQEREDTLTIWNDIAGATTNPYLFIVPLAKDKIKYYRAKIVFPPSNCNSFSSEINFKIIESISNLKLGDFLAGGLYFYHTNTFALLAAPTDQNRTSWGCEGIEINGADSSGIGDGEENTQSIIDQCKELGIAAYQADTLTLNGFTDWFLPSINELQLMIESLYDQGHGFISESYYWSSTESNKNLAWAYATIGKKAFEANKYDKYRRVHPIRKLNLKVNNNYNFQFQLLPNEEIYDIKILPVQGNLTNVHVIHTGEGKETDNYIWDFGYGKIISGSGKGPYEINYNFGGYNKISVKNSSSNCANDIAQSDYFRVKLFENLNLKLPHIHLGAFDWGDYNNDGLLDILMTGGLHFEIYKNVGIDSFNIIPLQFPKITLSGCDWGDFNNDKLLDFAVCGLADSICITEVYQNIGNDSFVKLNINLPGVKNGFVKWFDQNNDGILELLLSGEDNNNQALTKIYSGFTKAEPIEFNTNILSLKNSNGSFGDYNKDGLPDLLILGNDGTNRRTLLYKNENGQFVLIPTHFIDIEYGSVDWGDYDNDGALDFAITGAKDSIGIEYFNGGGGLKVSFSKVVFAGVYRQILTDSFNHYIVFDKFKHYALSELDWGDYDNDGYIDLAIAGVPRLSYESRSIGGGKVPITYPSRVSILRNFQDHTFNNIFADIPSFLEKLDNGTIIEGVDHGFACSYIAFGDYNNDGNLDLLREGTGAYGSSIYRNLTSVKNFPPNVPKDLYSILECNKAQVSWNNAQDDHTPTQSIIYEIYIGSSPGKSDVLSEVNTYNIRNTHFVINNLKPGTYYWSVKAIDQAQSASVYAPEQSFIISPKPLTPVISFNGIKLHSDSANGNQWHDQNGPVIGANQQEFVPIANGIYYVVISSNGCSSDTSNRIQVILSDIDNQDASQIIKVYPNPVDDILILEASGNPFKIPFQIINGMGQVIYEGVLKSRIQIPTSLYTSGVYFIKFQTGNLLIIKKLIKE